LFLNELSDFFDKSKECLLPGLEEAIYPLKIIDAIRKSSKELTWIKV